MSRSARAVVRALALTALLAPCLPGVARGDASQVPPSFTTLSNPNEILDLAIDDEGVVWTVGTGGVTAWSPNGDAPRRFTVDDGLSSNLATSITIGGDGTVWVGTWDGGLDRFDGSAWSTVRRPELPLRWVDALTTAPNGTVWAAGTIRTASGWRSAVAHRVGETWVRVASFKGWVRDLVASRHREVWAATFSKGVVRIRRMTVTRFREGDGLAYDYVRSIAMSPTGEVWVATSGGISRYAGASWKTFRPGRVCQSMVAGANPQGVWCGGPGPSVLRFDAPGGGGRSSTSQA